MVKVNDILQYCFDPDFFAFGFTEKEIEKIILAHWIAGERFRIYTAGFNADWEFLKFLSERYPDKFQVHLSIVTFEEEIRRKFMNPSIDVERMKKACTFLVNPTYFLLYFNQEQIISDVEFLNDFSLQKSGLIYIHRLYYNKLSDPSVVEYSDQAENDFQGSFITSEIIIKGWAVSTSVLRLAPNLRSMAGPIARRSAKCWRPFGEMRTRQFSAPKGLPGDSKLFQRQAGPNRPCCQSIRGLCGLYDRPNGSIHYGQNRRHACRRLTPSQDLPSEFYFLHSGAIRHHGDTVEVIRSSFPSWKSTQFKFPTES